MFVMSKLTTEIRVTARRKTNHEWTQDSKEKKFVKLVCIYLYIVKQLLFFFLKKREEDGFYGYNIHTKKLREID